MPALKDKLKKIQEERSQSLWEGPCSDGPNGGITQSMLSNFLECRERFRVKYVLGLQPLDDFNKSIEYGSMWHCCEESLAAKDKDPWAKLDVYAADLCKKYPLKQSEVIHWYNIVKLQFPIYRSYWEHHADVKGRKPLLEEESFNVPYQLPSGRMVRLRGKFDSVDLVNKEVWLQENKTKGEIDPVTMQRNLMFDLQTGLYLVALRINKIVDVRIPHSAPIKGIRYNVIRRPLSGGKGSIKQKKNQSEEEFYKELETLMKGAVGPEWGMPPGEHFYFMRWRIEFTSEDIHRFTSQLLDPILEQLCDWYDFVATGPNIWAHGSIHWRTPYGLYSTLYGAKGSPSMLDEYLDSGSMLGLHRADRLFKELGE